MGEAKRVAIATAKANQIINNAFSFAQATCAMMTCEKCSYMLGDGEGSDDCEYCKPVRAFLGFERASRIVKPAGIS